MVFKLLNGAASPANCARNIPGPLIVLIASSTPLRIYDEVLTNAPASTANGRNHPHPEQRRRRRWSLFPGSSSIRVLACCRQRYALVASSNCPSSRLLLS